MNNTMNNNMNRDMNRGGPEAALRITETQDAIEKLNSVLIAKCKQTDLLFDKLIAVLRPVPRPSDDKSLCIPSMYSCALPCAIEEMISKLSYDNTRIDDLINRLEV